MFVFAMSVSVFADDTVTIGVLAKRGNEQAIEQWGLHAQYLSNELGMPFKIVPLNFDAAGQLQNTLIWVAT
ncbi:MAG TPA: hypothetical protein VJL89_04030 [Thermodesulfovibrionia bacterium]|nr:hypothetical protein [Thermodesulfovibrionia bacterium]